MAKSRLKNKFLSRVPEPPSRASYKNTIVWQWLQFVTVGDDDIGSVVRVLRKRVDMPNQFPHTSYLRGYLRRCKLPEHLIEQTYRPLWVMYAEYRDAVLHNSSDQPIAKGHTRNPWGEPHVTGEPKPVKSRSTDHKWLSR